MKLRVLGCCGGSAQGRHPTSFLLDDRIAVDCGAITATLTPEEQEAIDHVVLSHAHLDHVASLPFLLDNLFARQTRPVALHAPEETLAALRSDLFNNRLWPDFTALRNNKSVSLELRAVRQGEVFHVGGLEFRASRMAHPVPCFGYEIGADRRSIFIAGDTGSAEAVKRACAGAENLAAVIIEVSWPNRLDRLAVASGHLTPAALAAAWPIHPSARVLVTHIKPFVEAEVIAELNALALPNLTILRDGDRFEF